MIGYNPDSDYLTDPQQARVVYRCMCCKREIYSLFTEICERCLFDMELEDD